ncbi:S41 family peptidase [Ktedonosporobacter rubrisoli]|nr:S41 family peptidase [Ktedonosporobacter rubrisoli]
MYYNTVFVDKLPGLSLIDILFDWDKLTGKSQLSGVYEEQMHKYFSHAQGRACFCAAYLITCYLLFLIFPFHWPTLVLFAGLALLLILVSFSPSALLSNGLSALAWLLLLTYGIIYALGLQEYWLLAFASAGTILQMVAPILWRKRKQVTRAALPRRRFVSLLLILILLPASFIPCLRYVILPQPAVYLASALWLMRTNAYRSSQLDWPQVIHNAEGMIQQARSSEDTYSTINYVLTSLGDHHSALIGAQQALDLSTGIGHGPGFLVEKVLATSWLQHKAVAVAFVFPGSSADRAGIKPGDIVTLLRRTPTEIKLLWQPGHSWQKKAISLDLRIPYAGELGTNGYRLADNIGYVNLYGTTGNAPQHYASQLQNLIKRLDTQPTCGWIIDLRLNTGGNIYPMLQGLGPILGAGSNLLSYVGPNGKVNVSFGYRNGAILIKGSPASFVPPLVPAYQPKIAQPPVALLISGNTASSGEGVLMAFLGRPATRTFGETTAGLSSSNITYQLIDGALLNIMSDIGMDRSGKVYGSTIQPDEAVKIDWSHYGTSQDPVIQRAERWLSTQAMCKASTAR